MRESRPNLDLLSVVGLPAGSRVSTLCSSIRRGCAAARVLLLGSVSVDGLRPTDVSGRPSRHRSVPAIFGRQALPYGFSRSGVAFHSGRCQRIARRWRIYADFAQVLIRLARPLYAADAIGVELQQSLYALDSTTIDLCAFAVSLGQSSGSTRPLSRCTRCTGPAREHPHLYQHYCRQSTRRQYFWSEILPEPGAFYVMDRGYAQISSASTSSC